MLSVSLALAVALLILSRRVRGPIWAASLAWIICIAPIVFGVISYRFLDFGDPRLGSAITGAMLAFAAGAGVELLYRGPVERQPISSAEARSDLVKMLPIARFCWMAGMAGGACVVLDFYFNGVGSLLNLAELRDAFVSKEQATPLARAGSVLTWACLFSYLFALIFRRELGHWQTAVFALPVVGFLLGGILAAGRQAAFQLIIVTVMGQVLWRIRQGEGEARKQGRGLVITVFGLMATYMGYIAIARNDNRISDIKSEVLARFFDFTMAPSFEAVMSLLGSSIRETTIEALVYFSSSVALFGCYLQTDLVNISHGAMDFPFVYRQLQPITGINVGDMYQLKVAALDAQQVIGVGWTTAVSHLIMDFGFTGAAAFLAVQGFASSLAWRAAVSGGTFLDCVLATLMVIAAIYLPLLPAFADNNLFVLALFCLACKGVDIRRRRALQSAVKAPA